MKVTRLKAIQMFQALGQLERGVDGQPYNLDFSQFELAYVMMARFKETIEAWQKAREQRMKVIAGGTPINKTAAGPVIADDKKMALFNEQEQAAMEEVVRIPRFPKKRLELATDKNKYPPGLLINLQGLFVDNIADKFEVEDEEDKPPAVVEPARNDRPYVRAAE